MPCCLSLCIHCSGLSVMNPRKILVLSSFWDARILVSTQTRTPGKSQFWESPTRKQKTARFRQAKQRRSDTLVVVSKIFFYFSPRMFGEDDSHFDLHLFFKLLGWNHQLRITTSWFWAIGANRVDPEVVNWPWPHACGSMSWNNVTQVLGMGNPAQKGKPKEKPESMSGWIS